MAEVTPADEARVGNTLLRMRVTPEGSQDTAMAAGTGAVAGGRSPGGWPVIVGYRIESEIGRGNMGVVWRAIRESDGRAVAIKSILPVTAPTRNLIGRFVREADILEQLSHPNVVACQGSGAAEGFFTW